MLQNILVILAKHEVMPETMLANKLNTTVDTLQPMMKLLQRRGQVEIVQSGDCKGGCGCVMEQKIAYRWLNKIHQQQTPMHIISVA